MCDDPGEVIRLIRNIEFWQEHIKTVTDYKPILNRDLETGKISIELYNSELNNIEEQINLARKNISESIKEKVKLQKE